MNVPNITDYVQYMSNDTLTSGNIISHKTLIIIDANVSISKIPTTTNRDVSTPYSISFEITLKSDLNVCSSAPNTFKLDVASRCPQLQQNRQSIDMNQHMQWKTFCSTQCCIKFIEPEHKQSTIVCGVLFWWKWLLLGSHGLKTSSCRTSIYNTEIDTKQKHR